VVKRIVAQEKCVEWHRKVSEQAGNTAQQAFADITFGESWSETLSDEKVWARHLGPGHTGGDAIIFFEKANVVHGGDLLFRRVHPRVDAPAGASVVNWIKILEEMARRHDNDTAFVFGHGKDGAVLGKKADVTYFRDYLSAALDRARQGIKAGSSREETAKIQALKGFEDVAQVNPRLSLAGVIEAAFDELSRR
jgi:glyoxylase-like metal-dependent hydrolase (beta-lactamase superfamily II)